MDGMDISHICICLLHYSKAFNVKNKKLLLTKLKLYSMEGAMLQWFGDYFSNRIELVKFESVVPGSIRKSFVFLRTAYLDRCFTVCLCTVNLRHALHAVVPKVILSIYIEPQ